MWPLPPCAGGRGSRQAVSGEAWLVSRAFEAESVVGPARSRMVLRLGPARRGDSLRGRGGTQPGPSPRPHLWVLGLLGQESLSPNYGVCGPSGGDRQWVCRSAAWPGHTGAGPSASPFVVWLCAQESPSPSPSSPFPSTCPPPTHTPTPAVGQMNYSLRLGARAGEGLKLWGWPFKWLLAPPPLWCPDTPYTPL